MSQLPFVIASVARQSMAPDFMDRHVAALLAMTVHGLCAVPGRNWKLAMTEVGLLKCP